ncbi:MAG: bifunctional diaminohydroxyphosphoribosylaminopyrimidine deaminase/5-amino-6-(5-phosphoribosylamino)uracil reductase RibD [Elusimicrobiota bacterium]
MTQSADEKFMRVALEEAARGEPLAYPNPLVGCVIVRRGKIIGRGHHAFYGGPHAEVNAVNSCRTSASGADIYVNMEPCSSKNKKNPPCTDLLLRIKPERVIIGDIDPNPAHNGRAVEILKRAGIKVKTGVLRSECAAINAPFYKNMLEKMPYVILKAAQSLNGRIADNRGNSRWISSNESRDFSHLLRASSDCILAGAETITKDNPQLTVRSLKVPRQPAVCVIDPDLRTPASARIFRAERPVYIITSCGRKSLKYGPGVSLLPVKKKASFLDIEEGLKKLYSLGIRRILVEGGGRTNGQFILNGLFDKFYLFIAPLVIGQENSVASVSWPDRLSHGEGLGIKLKLQESRPVGKDWLLVYGKENVYRTY